MSIRAAFAATILAAGLIAVCEPAVPALAAAGTDIVNYHCTGGAQPQDVKIQVTLTMPTDATVNVQTSIGWQGTYADGTSLLAPASGLGTGAKLYAYASISGPADTTSGTGVATLDTIGGGQAIRLPTDSVPVNTTVRTAGTVTVRPGAINFGTATDDQPIKCEVTNKDALTTYSLTVAAGNQQSASPTPSPTPSTEAETTSPQPTDTVTATVTETPANGTVAHVPAGGANTGGGGQAGPDGRVLVLTGLALILAAVTGLLLRRRALRDT